VSERQVDARGLACPQPVVLTRKAMAEDGVDLVRVVVDQEIPAENIQRLAQGQGWQSEVANQGDEIHLTLRRDSRVAERAATESGAPGDKENPTVVVFVTSNLFGDGDERLGQILMRAFVKTLKELDTQPAKVIFANAGVRLTTSGSDLIADLAQLEQGGVEIMSCGTCLDYYHLSDALEVGSVSNMFDIATSLVDADRVVKL
jgi:selenium metabolism protein YedF